MHLLKKEPGQDFPDLDMLTKLLQSQRPRVNAKVDALQRCVLFAWKRVEFNYIYLLACSLDWPAKHH